MKNILKNNSFQQSICNIRLHNDRLILLISGQDAKKWLNRLITNNCLFDSKQEKKQKAVWAAFLNPQGRYLADFLVFSQKDNPDNLLIDVDKNLADNLINQLKNYRLRAKIEINTIDSIYVYSIHATDSEQALDEKDVIAHFTDPRHALLGERLYSKVKLQPSDSKGDASAWVKLRIKIGLPEHPHELIVGKSLLMEQRFDQLQAIDWHKGCYIGQEVTARMKHRLAVSKQLTRLTLSSGTISDDSALYFDKNLENLAGSLLSRDHDSALALVKVAKNKELKNDVEDVEKDVLFYQKDASFKTQPFE